MKAKSLLKTVTTVTPTLTVSLLTVLILITALYGTTTHAADPEFQQLTKTVYIDEDARVLSLIRYDVRVTGASGTLTYAITDDESADSDSDSETDSTMDGDSTYFKLNKDSGQLQLNKKVDFERPRGEELSDTNTNEYVVVITASDDGDATDANDATLTLTIIVENVNEAPMFTDEENGAGDLEGLQIKRRTVVENTPAGENINVVAGTDAPVVATDPDDTTADGDTNPETSRIDSLIYTMTGADARYFDIDSTSGQLKTKTVLDFETPMDTGGGTAKDNFYTVTVIATDSESRGLDSRVTVTIEVTDDNEAPEFPAQTASRSVPENAPAGTKVGMPLKATDPEGDPVTYTTASDNFIIESDGQLRTKVRLDHEAMPSHPISVTATDDGVDGDAGAPNDNLSNTIVVTITVTDANDPPMFDSATTTRMVAENQRAGIFGTAIEADDQDPDALTYTVTNVPGRNDARLFTINGSTGHLSTRNPLDREAEDYPFTSENAHGYMVRVTVSDRKNDAGRPDTVTVMDDTIDVTITVENVNEPPAFGAATASNLYFYESTSSTTVYDPDGVLIATDPDVGDTTLMYDTPAGPDGAEFTIVGGVLTAEPKDFEEDKRTYTVVVTVKDDESPVPLSDIITLTIHLRDVGEDVTNRSPMFVDENGDSLDMESFSVRENADSLFIGTVRATDPDNDQLTYTVDATSAALFRIDRTGELRSKKPLDYEAIPDEGDAYEVTVTATDGTSNEATIMVTVTVMNVNEAPVFGTLAIPIMRATRTVEENTIAGEEINVDTPVSAVDPEGDTLTYTLGGDDAASFDIVYSDPMGGQLKTRAPLDADTKSTYKVMVVASDGKLSTSIPVEIEVTDVNERPMFDAGARITIEMPEDISMMANVDMPIKATDPEGDMLTYDIDNTDTTNSPDYEKFEIREQYGQLYYSGMDDHTVDFEDGPPFYQIKVTVSDGNTQGNAGADAVDDSIIVIIKVTNVNEPPMFPMTFPHPDVGDALSAPTHEVPENTMAGYPTNGLLTATDPERDVVTYRLANAPGSTDAASFTIDNTGQLRVKTSLDFETKREYRVIVHATDNKNARGARDTTTSDDEVVVTIRVTGINEPPMFVDGETATRSIPETVGEPSPDAIPIGAPIVANDPEMGELTYGLTDTTFEIDPGTGQLSLKSDVALDYEATPLAMLKRTYTLMVTVRDGTKADGTTTDDSDDDTITVTVNVLNAPEPPMFPTVPDPSGVYVHAGKVGNEVFDPNGVFTATDPDGDRLTYQLTGGNANFSLSSGMLKTTKVLTATPDDDDGLSVTVSARDRRVTVSQTAFIKVVGVTATKKAPVFPDGSDARAIDENESGNVGDRVEATSEADADETYAYILGGTDASKFSINSETGQLMVREPLDFEKGRRYTVTVTATDGVLKSTPQTVTITVNNVDEPPMFTDGATTTRTILETPVGATFTPANVRGPVTATDPEGDPFTYEVSTNDHFEIVSVGQLRTKAGLNHEGTEDGTYTVTITARSSGGGRDTIEVTITATDVNDAPMFADSDGAEIQSATRTVAENEPKGTLINAADSSDDSPVMATDEDEGSTVTHTLTGADASRFDIEPSTGQLITKSVLDFEAIPQKRFFNVTVRADDGRGGRAEIPVTIRLTDANDRPMFPARRITREVKESTTAINVGLPVTATDPEADAHATEPPNLTYAISGPDALFFTIDAKYHPHNDRRPAKNRGESSHRSLISSGL